MSAIPALIVKLRSRTDLSVVDETSAWLIRISRSDHSVCDIVVPHNALEWFASIVDGDSKHEIWSDWMDYSGYDKRPKNLLEAEMTQDISDFIDRIVSTDVSVLPNIYQKST